MRVALWLLLVACLPLAAADVWVSPTGDDAAVGSRELPWRTLQHAADRAQPGDTVHVLPGVYRETVRPAASGEPNRPIRFVAEGEAIVSGADALTGEWQPHEGSIYKLATDRRFIQLFLNGAMAHEARWPNTPATDLMRMNRAAAGEGTDYERLADPNLPAGDWNGAVILIWPGSRWTNITRRVTDYRPGEGFRFDRTTEQQRKDEYHTFDPYKPQAGNPYILYGVLPALDSPGEWLLDEAAGTLYLWSPDGRSPAEHGVEVKQREVAFDLHGLANIELVGLGIHAAGVDLRDAEGCLIEDCRLRYLEHVREFDFRKDDPVNETTGRNNTWRRCSLAYSSGSLLRLAGEDNRIEDCRLWDGDYIGGDRPLLSLHGAVGAQVIGNTICRAGRDIVGHGRAKRIRIERNDIWGANLLNNDSGATYAWGTDGEGSTIAYNWVHDNVGDSTVGIYLDNFCKNFFVHHNVVWRNSGTGIRLNSDATNHVIANNTIAESARPFGTYTYHNRVSTMEGTRIVNNLVLAILEPNDAGMFVQGELGPELLNNGAFAIGPRAMPLPGSGAIDAGVVIEGINDDHVGDAPDIGAYEFGGEAWVPGASWADPEAPVAPPMDLSFAPHPPITPDTMITDGLALWLDADDPASFELADGRIARWRDKSGRGHDALPREPEHLLTVKPNAWNGRAVVAGDGEGSFLVGDLREATGPFTLFIVARGPEPGPRNWQRLIGAYNGEGNDWTRPNWMVLRAGGGTPEPFGPALFHRTELTGHNLMNVTVMGSPVSPAQHLMGDVAEVLLFDRALAFDETVAVENYLREKWALGE